MRTGGIGGRVVAAAAGLVLLVGGTAFAATQLGSSNGDPEDAVAELFDAIAAEDVLGALATLDPGERDALTGPVEDLFAELERLEVLDDDFEPTNVSGVDLEFEGLTFDTEEIRSDLFRVYLTGGTASYGVTTDDLPIGAFLADTFERFDVPYQGITENDSDTIPGDDAGDDFLVVRDAGDGWRVSLGYTAAEAARLSNGKAVPAAGAGLGPVGADSPQAALEGFLQAAAALDVEGVVARLSPAEFGALQDYWPVMVDDADLPSAEQLGVAIELTDLALRSSDDGDDRAQVFIDAIGVDVVADDVEAGATIADGCISLWGDARDALAELNGVDPDEPLCQEDLEALVEEAMGEMGGMDLDLFGMGSFAPDPDAEVPAIGVTTTKVDGSWYVAPIGTYADMGIAVLRVLDREDLDAAVDAVESFFESFGTAMSGGFVPPSLGGGGFEELDAFADELGEVEDLQELDDELGSAMTSELPRPGASQETMAVRAEKLLSQLVNGTTGDPDVARCVLDVLYTEADTEVLYELADAYELDFEPSMAAQDVFFGALEACAPSAG